MMTTILSTSFRCDAAASRHCYFTHGSWRGSAIWPSRAHFSHRSISALQHTVAASSTKRYQGMYGTWTLEPSDILEVTMYRASLTAMAAAFALGTAHSLSPTPTILPGTATTWAAIVGDAALGVALTQIHIYVTPLKRFVQGLWLVGTLGGVWVLAAAGGGEQTDGLAAYAAAHRESVWLFGCSFASLTGVCFKEGLCYGKAEAFLLTFLIPSLLLGHLTGVLPDPGEKGLAAVIAALLVVFAARKWTQKVEDDIGDKSVFEMQAMSPEEREIRLAKLRELNGLGSGDEF